MIQAVLNNKKVTEQQHNTLIVYNKYRVAFPGKCHHNRTRHVCFYTEVKGLKFICKAAITTNLQLIHNSLLYFH